MIISANTVNMINVGLTFFRWRQEMFCDKSVNGNLPFLIVSPESDSMIAVVVIALRKRFTSYGEGPLIFTCDHSIEAFNITVIANHIKRFITFDGFPGFHALTSLSFQHGINQKAKGKVEVDNGEN
jgi:hypothetical protein